MPAAPPWALLPPPRAPPIVARLYPSQVHKPRPIWEEDWDVDSEGFRSAAAPPAPADFMLRQIEEIEASIRKKRTPPAPDSSHRGGWVQLSLHLQESARSWWMVRRYSRPRDASMRPSSPTKRI